MNVTYLISIILNKDKILAMPENLSPNNRIIINIEKLKKKK